MKHKAYLVKGLLALVLLAIALGGGVAQGQGPAPQSSASVQAALGTAFTYQGRLTDSGVPADGAYDFRFKLWDSLSGGTPVGSTIDKDDVAVTNGLFTVQLDFGSNAFTGDARYLGIGVRPGDSPGAFTALTPRQELTPAPYAVYAPTAGSAPWSGLTGVPAGFADGTDDDTTYTAGVGLTLVGGNEFRVSFGGSGSATTVARSDHDHGSTYWRLSGNSGTSPGTDFLGTTDNQPLELHVNGSRALRLEPNANSPNLIGGHISNTVTSGVVGATIGGGGTSSDANRVTDYYSTVGGGLGNQAGNGDTDLTNSFYTTISGGRQNTASGKVATVGGGRSNTASNEGATVGGGGFNTADGFHATIAGGYQNTASGNRSTIPGGSQNTALGKFSLAAGAQAQASLYGQMAFASGQFASAGDAQTSVFVLRNTTTSATAKKLFLDGSSERLTIASNRTVTFDILVAARSSGGASAGYRIRGVIENTGGNTDFVGTPTVETLGEEVASWEVAVQANDTYDALVVQVTGDASRTIRWVATVKTAEVGW